jgi:hypothetical protein
MLKRVMTTQQAESFLQAKYPGRVEFRNHRSFYDHWDFASGEVVNLFTVAAATLLPIGAERPVLVHPFGVASTAGKNRLICDARALNIFLKNLPFQHEKLRDVLAYTKAGFFMVTWDLKAGYYHIPIHPDFRKYFGFKIGIGMASTMSFASACQKLASPSPKSPRSRSSSCARAAFQFPDT